MTMQLFDAAPISTRRKTTDGFLVAQARAARTGVQVYSGAEVKRPDLAMVRVMRPEAEVFDRTSLSTYGTAPITVGHPPSGVTADTWKQFAVGHVGEGVVRDGEYVALPLILKDADAIRQLEAGTRELSVGYNCSLDFTPGSANGVTWDAVQRGIRVNHVALVPRGRAGSECRISDAAALDDGDVSFLDSLPASVASRIGALAADTHHTEVFRVQAAAREARSLRAGLASSTIAHAGFADAAAYLGGLAARADAHAAKLLGITHDSTERTTTMTINDALNDVPSEFRIKTLYALGDLKGATRFQVEDGIRNAQGLIGRMEMTAGGQFARPPGFTTDANMSSMSLAAGLLAVEVEAARTRLASMK